MRVYCIRENCKRGTGTNICSVMDETQCPLIVESKAKKEAMEKAEKESKAE